MSGTSTPALDALLNRAGALVGAGRISEAAAVARQAVDCHPASASALKLAGSLDHLCGDSRAARNLLLRARSLAPEDAGLHYNLGVVCAALNEAGAAKESYRAALALDGRHCDALHNLANLEFIDGEDEAAQLHFTLALGLRPEDVRLELALAQLAMARRDLDQAGRHFERAAAIAPDDPQVRWERAHWQLVTGDFAAGWEGYDARFLPAANSGACRYPFGQRLWQGEPVAGRHLLVHGEQGFGDEIMFFSLVPELVAAGARVTLVGQPELTPLWQASFPGVRCLAQARVDGDRWTRAPSTIDDSLARDPPDFQVPCASLARWLRSEAAHFGARPPVVGVDPARRARAAQWLEAHGLLRTRPKPRVGLVWAGHSGGNDPIARRKDSLRSLSDSARDALLALPGIDWVRMQTGSMGAGVSGGIDGAELMQDFAASAALMAELDLVVTVDTASAHLAGALGRPTWVLLPYAGEWRWGTNPERCPWWSSARLFRQAARDDWDSVVARVGAALGTHASAA